MNRGRRLRAAGNTAGVSCVAAPGSEMAGGSDDVVRTAWICVVLALALDLSEVSADCSATATSGREDGAGVGAIGGGGGIAAATAGVNDASAWSISWPVAAACFSLAGGSVSTIAAAGFVIAAPVSLRAKASWDGGGPAVVHVRSPSARSSDCPTVRLVRVVVTGRSFPSDESAVAIFSSAVPNSWLGGDATRRTGWCPIAWRTPAFAIDERPERTGAAEARIVSFMTEALPASRGPSGSRAASPESLSIQGRNCRAECAGRHQRRSVYRVSSPIRKVFTLARFLLCPRQTILSWNGEEACRRSGH